MIQWSWKVLLLKLEIVMILGYWKAIHIIWMLQLEVTNLIWIKAWSSFVLFLTKMSIHSLFTFAEHLPVIWTVGLCLLNSAQLFAFYQPLQKSLECLKKIDVVRNKVSLSHIQGSNVVISVKTDESLHKVVVAWIAASCPCSSSAQERPGDGLHLEASSNETWVFLQLLQLSLPFNSTQDNPTGSCSYCEQRRTGQYLEQNL